METTYTDETFQELLQPTQLEKIFYEYEKRRQAYSGYPNKFSMGTDSKSYTLFRRESNFHYPIISKQALSGDYQFQPFHRQMIKKNSVKHRVVGVASIQDTLVQKALGKAIYETVESLFSGQPVLDQAVCSHRKGRSAPYASLQIHHYLKAGYRYALRADIVQFYDSIPNEPLAELLRNLFGQDTLTSKMLIRYIATRYTSSTNEVRSPEQLRALNQSDVAENKNYQKSGIVVGGVLSGMLSNLYLYDFDLWVTSELLKRYNSKYIRYVDNLLFLSKEDVSNELIELVTQRLREKGLILHGAPKTKQIDVALENLEYLDFQFSPSHILVGSRNIEELKRKILNRIGVEPDLWQVISEPRQRFIRFIDKRLNVVLSGRFNICNTCGRMLPLSKSWIKYFSVITTTAQLHALDKWIRMSLSSHFYKNYGLRLKRRDFRDATLISLEQEYYRIQKYKPCRCG